VVSLRAASIAAARRALRVLLRRFVLSSLSALFFGHASDLVISVSMMSSWAGSQLVSMWPACWPHRISSSLALRATTSTPLVLEVLKPSQSCRRAFGTADVVVEEPSDVPGRVVAVYSPQHSSCLTRQIPLLVKRCTRVSDDGVSGADLTYGSGLLVLRDRVDAIGGTMT
jgi:hypothetical protein